MEKIRAWSFPVILLAVWLLAGSYTLASLGGAQAAVSGRPIPPAGIRGSAAGVSGRFLIGASAGRGQAPAGVPRGFRTAVAHAPLSRPGRVPACRRDLAESPSIMDHRRGPRYLVGGTGPRFPAGETARPTPARAWRPGVRAGFQSVSGRAPSRGGERGAEQAKWWG